jgi:CcmD family protein
MASGSINWILAGNIIIWTGLFLYLLRLERRLNGHVSTDVGRQKEKDPR